MENRIGCTLVEHWDVIEDEATQEQSKSGNPMFGELFPHRAWERMKSKGTTSTNEERTTPVA
jgi:hypothetical protein